MQGSAAISQSGNATTINQSSSKAIIDWQSFSVGAKESVTFQQPSSSAVTLNRVIGNETSVISGALNANGQVFLVNSAGVIITKGAQVNVGGLVASTLDITNQDFMSGHYAFSGTSAASIVNQGKIHANGGGYVALLGKTVSNDGVITATLGTVAMASGNKITLNFSGDSLVDVTLDAGTLNALVANKGVIKADGGSVILTAKAADALLSAQVNNTGVIQARTMAALKGATGTRATAHKGSIKLYADGGTTYVGGTLDASAPKGGDGGKIETSGNKVKIADDAVITTKAATGQNGTWLIDPNGFTIGAGGDISANLLGTLLASNNITLASTSGSGTDGNINVNGAVSWAADTILTLNATNNINVNANITATGANAGLVMNYGGNYNIVTPATYSGVGMTAPSGTVYSSITLSGQNATLAINGTTYTLIHSMSDLAAASGTGAYAIAQNLDASGTTYTGAVLATLNGSLAGLGHTITNLTINAPTQSNVGLIGTVKTAGFIRDIGLVDVNVVGGTYVGALVGNNQAQANISQAYVTGGIVRASNVAGGLVGYNAVFGTTVFNTISDSFSDVTVVGPASGGLVGRATNLTLNRDHASGDVFSPSSNAGGLIGYAANVSIYSSYATGNVTGGSADGISGITTYPSYAIGIGGLIGTVATASSPAAQVIENSYATGSVTGAYELGGLIGMLSANANYTIDHSYYSPSDPTKGVTGTQPSGSLLNVGIGGLIGVANLNNPGTLTVTYSYSTGNVGFTGSGTNAGGLVGYISGNAVIDHDYATGNVTGGPNGTATGGLIGIDSSTTTITSSYATGNVSGNLTVGGLVGGNSGSISNSYATGNVTGSDNNIGGLVGTNTMQGSITGSYATGTVTGTGAGSWTGGLVGTNSGAISNSYFAGVVTGPAGKVGGLVGENFNNSGDPNCTSCGSITNSYYNSDINGGLGMTGNYTPIGGLTAGHINGGGGLTNLQFKDLQYYLNGTINQVLAQRAAEAAAAAAAAAKAVAEAKAAAGQAAARTGDGVASGAQLESNAQPNPALLSSAGSQATAALAPQTIEGNVTIEQPRAAPPASELRRRNVAAGHKGSGRDKDYGASIRSIDVNGQHYELQNGTPKNGASGTATPSRNAQ